MTNLSMRERDLYGGERTYSRRDYEDYLRKAHNPAFATERETKYRHMTPQGVAGYLQGVSPRADIPMGVPASQAERDASRVLETGRGPMGGELPAAAAGGRSVVQELLAGGPPGRKTGDGERRTGEEAPPPEPVTGWGGTMRSIPRDTGLFGTTPQFGPHVGHERTLQSHRERFDRNLAELLHQRGPGGWQSREEYEREIAGMPSAGQEILPHVQRRALESMPVGFRSEMERQQMMGEAETKALAQAGAREAVERQWMESAPKEAVETYESLYTPTPMGPQRIREPRSEVSEDEYQRFVDTQSKDVVNEFKRSYIRTPTGWARKPRMGMADTFRDAMATQDMTPEERTQYYVDMYGVGRSPGATPGGGVPGESDLGARPPPDTEDRLSLFGRLKRQLLPQPAGAERPAGDVAGVPIEGQTAVNPQTGERLIFRNGKWEAL
jgi:hypothetical protein